MRRVRTLRHAGSCQTLSLATSEGGRQANRPGARSRQRSACASRGACPCGSGDFRFRGDKPRGSPRFPLPGVKLPLATTLDGHSHWTGSPSQKNSPAAAKATGLPSMTCFPRRAAQGRPRPSKKTSGGVPRVDTRRRSTGDATFLAYVIIVQRTTSFSYRVMAVEPSCQRTGAAAGATCRAACGTTRRLHYNHGVRKTGKSG
jgi:hypothetical protein